jgi:hypothetical protein
VEKSIIGSKLSEYLQNLSFLCLLQHRFAILGLVVDLGQQQALSFLDGDFDRITFRRATIRSLEFGRAFFLN